MRYTQPQGGPIQINWANPITRGVRLLISGTDPGRSIYGPVVTQVGTVARVTGPAGQYQSFNGTNQGLSASLNLSNTQAVTVVAVLHIPAGTASQQNLWEHGTDVIATYAGFNAYINNTGQLEIWTGSGSPSRDGNTYALPSVGTHTLVAVYDHTKAAGAQISLYVDGVFQTRTASGGSTGAAGVFPIDTLYISSRTSSASWAGDRLALFSVIERAVTPAEATSLSANPWQIFKSQQRVMRVGAGGITGADGSSLGSSSLTAVSAAIAGVYGTSAGLASVLGAANSVFQTTGASSGTSSPSASANAITQATGTSLGVSVTGGTSQTVFTTSGSSSGVATGSGTTVSITRASGLSAGNGSVGATGASVSTTSGASSGLASATASAVSISTTNGSSVGTATLSGNGNVIWQVTGSSAGVATVYSTSSVSGGIIGADGSSSGSATVSGQGLTLSQAIAQALGSSTASGTGVMIAASTGSAAGAASVSGGANSVAGSSGSASGLSTAQSTVVVVFQASGMSLGASTIDGVAASIRSAIGASSGSATVSGVTQGGIHYTAYGDKFNITLVFSQYDIKLQPNQYTMELQR